MTTLPVSDPFPTPFSEMDWRAWKPVEQATLLFVVDGQRILLIEKKRGLGAGKINGPGGRMEPGETPIACAIREVEEEILITPVDPQPAGELFFQFTDGYALHGFVFRSEGWSGEPGETEEALPFWCDTDRIPYDRMWADDRIWFPLFLANRPFQGRFLFDGDRMLGHAIEELASPRDFRVDATCRPESFRFV